MPKMNQMGGWIKLPRNIMEFRYSPESEHRSFTKFEAYLDLLLIANHKNRLCGDVMVRRGQFYRTNQTLARRWNWPQLKVRRFKKQLKDAGVIDYPSKVKNIIPISICGYEEMQGPWNQKDDEIPLDDQPDDQLDDQAMST